MSNLLFYIELFVYQFLLYPFGHSHLSGENRALFCLFHRVKGKNLVASSDWKLVILICRNEVYVQFPRIVLSDCVIRSNMDAHNYHRPQGLFITPQMDCIGKMLIVICINRKDY